MLATVSSATVIGVSGVAVSVEVHVSDGLPGFTIVGLPDVSCREARDRVRAAILSSDFTWPMRRVTVNLAPSGVRKVGSGLDLAMAVGVLIASEQLPADAAADVGFVGELGLDGSLRPVGGALPMAAAVAAARVVVAPQAAAEAEIVRRGAVRTVASLRALGAALVGEGAWAESPSPVATSSADPMVDLAEVRGQPFARLALEVAAAGGHHLLMMGPPGTGKTMLAERIPTILPPLDDDTALVVSSISSVLGAGVPVGGLERRAPFRSPHHSASLVSMIGGGSSVLRPGEVSRAHGGVLFLDELGEFATAVLESLRQPLESRVVRVSRAHSTAEFPASFLLVAASNPCPCGFAPAIRCTCGPAAIARYRRRLSGPLIDRFDLRIRLEVPDGQALLGGDRGESSAAVAERVGQARARAASRGVGTNAELAPGVLTELLRTSAGADELLTRAAREGRLTGRGARRVRSVALTLDDLAGGDGRVGASTMRLALALRAELGDPAIEGRVA